MAAPVRSIGQQASKRIASVSLILSLVAVALVLRVAVFVVVSRDDRKLYAPDSTTYERLAVDLRTQGVFTLARVPPAGARFLAMTGAQRTAPVWSALLLVAVYAGAVVGLVTPAEERGWRILLLVTVVIGSMVILSVGAQAEPRFRVPLMPFVTLCTGVGLERLTSRGGVAGLRAGADRWAELGLSGSRADGSRWAGRLAAR